MVLIEFDHQAGISLDNDEPTRNHIHTVVRTPNGNDYGKDLLRQHREQGQPPQPSAPADFVDRSPNSLVTRPHRKFVHTPLELDEAMLDQLGRSYTRRGNPLWLPMLVVMLRAPTRDAPTFGTPTNLGQHGMKVSARVAWNRGDRIGRSSGRVS